MFSIGLITAFVAVALLAGSVGLLLGAMLSSSKVSALYDRLDRTEATNRAQNQLLEELTGALRLLLAELSTSQHSGLSAEGANGARQVLERITLAAEMRARLDEPKH